MAYTAQFPISSFLDVDGKPLENGYVYIGTAGLDPVGNPITVYWDAAATQVAAQPIRTIGGYPSNNGVRSRLYVNAVDYSIKVTNVNGTDTVPVALYNAEDAYAADIIFLQAGLGAVPRTVESKLRDTVSVKDFGAVGDGVTDDTAAMQAAHNTGKLVFYPVGVYLFNTITIGSGGISGEGKQSILKSTNTTTANLITYTGTDPSGLLINADGGLFQNFTVLVNSPTQKSDGAAIYVSRAPNENYLTIVSGVYTKNVPIGIDFSIASFFSVRDCYFSLYSVAGLRTVIDSATFADNGDNEIIGNWFFTTNAIGPSSFSMIIRCGGTRIIGNKINGGLIGIDVKPIRSTSIAIIEGNSIENQIINGVRAYIANDFIGVPASGEGFSFVQVVGNQIGGYNLAGGAIAFDSFDAANYKFYNCLVSDNIIYNPANTSSRAIDIRATDRFIVSNNFVDNATVGYGSLFVSSNSTQGLVTRNQFLRAATSNILNSSTTTRLDEIIAEYSTTYDPAPIAAGASLTLAVTVNGAATGNYVLASFTSDLSGVTLTAYVSAADTVTFVFFNGTVAPVDLASGTIRARVISN